VRRLAIDREAESESSTTSSTHPPSLGRPYTPSLSDDSSEVELDAEPLRKDSTNSDPSINSMDAGSTHQLETPESSVHRALVTSCSPSAMSWSDSPVADSLASSIAKGDAGENAVKHPPYVVVCRSVSLF
jgi:hypothetical protein